jgi:hypothetical protein
LFSLSVSQNTKSSQKQKKQKKEKKCEHLSLLLLVNLELAWIDRHRSSATSSLSLSLSLSDSIYYEETLMYSISIFFSFFKCVSLSARRKRIRERGPCGVINLKLWRRRLPLVSDWAMKCGDIRWI